MSSKPKRGRPALPEEHRRTLSKKIRWSPAEWAEIESAAERERADVGTYIRETALARARAER